MPSMTREWVNNLGLRVQGTLLTAMRGCDLVPKHPLDSPLLRLTAAFRYAVCVPFDEREVDAAPGCFMISHVPTDVRLSDFDHLPLHFFSHAMHVCEILGYLHPDPTTRVGWARLYIKFCNSLHVNPETTDQMVERLAEDRIANGTVVSL